MSPSRERESQEYLLHSRSSDASEFGDFGSPSRHSDQDDSQFKCSSPHQAPLGLIEPFAVDDSDLEAYPSSVWNRLKTSMRLRTRSRQKHPTLSSWPDSKKPWFGRSLGRRPRASRCVVYLVVGYLSILGLIHLTLNVLNALAAVFPNDIDWILDRWGQPGQPSESFVHWPTDATRGIHPVNCHSHNDYWRSVPLYAAIKAGCTGAEADAWLVDDEIHVGHRRYALTANRTLQNLYINPLLDLLSKQNPAIEFRPNEDYPLPPPSETDPVLNGVFDTDPSQTFVLLIDFKSSGPALWWQLFSQLTPLREKGYLTHFNGSAVVERPITVVGTGNAPFDFLTANETYRDVFFDAPLQDMADLSATWPNPNRAQDPTRGHHPNPESSFQSSFPDPLSPISRRDDRGQGRSGTAGLSPDAYNPSNSYYASTSFTRSVGRVWGSRLTQAQLQLVRAQIRGAHQRGLKVRYWALPSWPMGLRNHVWHILMREGVDILNVDDLRGATTRDWRRRKGWWY